MSRRFRAAFLGLAGAALAATAFAADGKAPQIVNPVGHWTEYEMIIQADAPLRGTLRQVYIDRNSWKTARLTGKLPSGTKLIMRDFDAIPDGKGGWKMDPNFRLLAGKPTAVLVQQKEKGWGTSHPENIRTGEWEFGLFTPEGKPIAVDAEKVCMPCHKQVEATDYTFLVARFFAEWKQQ